MQARLISILAVLALTSPAFAAPKAKAPAETKTPEKTPDETADKAQEPLTVAVSKLPKSIRTLHNCAPADGRVEMSQERFAKSVLFFVSCPAKARGGLQLEMVYVARDTKGTSAKRVTFEALAPDGSAAALEAVPSAIPARESFTSEDEGKPKYQSKNDPPWITGAWAPDDRPGICAIVANWRMQGEKAELWLWEEAKECPKNELPKYKSKVDKKPPPLVAQ